MMSNTAKQPMIVIGGGIGGLATALGIAETKQICESFGAST